MKKIVTVVLLVFTIMFFVKRPSVNALVINDSLEELRGVWVSTVSNIDIAKQKGNTEKAINDYKEELLSILNRAEYFGLNAIFFQVRPSNDAFYESAYNPWSQFFYQHGVNPGWDMLSWLADECHARGIELHAWLNPYRVTASRVASFSDGEEKINEIKLNLRKQAQNLYPEIDNPLNIKDDEEFLSTVVLGAEGQMVLNPAKQATIDHVTNTIVELIENYNVDGVHFDDYFYPSGGIESKYDSADYAAYKQNGGTLAVADWRRNNVDRMVKSVSDAVAEYNAKNPEQYTAFGISPAPVWAPSAERCPDGRGQEGGMDVICGSYSTYNTLYADTKKWVEEEWLDYILPQAYSSLENNYKEIVRWWSKICAPTKVKLYIGTGYYKLAETAEDSFGSAYEVENQFKFVRDNRYTEVDGFVLFSYKNLLSTTGNLGSANVLLKKAWNNGSLLPSYEEVKPITELPTVELTKLGSKYYMSFNEVANANGYALYAIPKGQAVDFSADGVIVQKIFNKLGTGDKQQYNALTDFSASNYDFYIRVFDNDNKPIDEYVKVDFDNAIINEGAQIEILQFEDRDYAVGEIIKVRASITSDLGLPLTVVLRVKYDDGGYTTKFNMVEVEPGIYEYEYHTLLDAVTQLKISVDDTDRTVEYELPAVAVGNAHKHEFVDGECACGEKDPNYIPPHEHEFVDGECACGEKDPNYIPPHEHEFVDGECACGEKDPNYEEPKEPEEPKQPSNGGMNCSMGFVSIIPLIGAATLLLIRKKK